MTTINFQPDFSFVNLNKPAGMTSFDCIRRIRRILAIKKTGHLGTLDPPATGVLPVAIGKSTRLIPYLENSGKVYEASVIFGITTATDDTDGEIITSQETAPFDIEILKKHLESFTGDIMQTPPAVSAVKIDGRRAYDIAFKGGTPDIKARKAFVKSIEITGYEHPRLYLTLEVGPGTYIRSIARDLGAILGCGAAVDTLERTKDGSFLIENSVTFEQLEKAVEEKNLQSVMIPAAEVMTDYPVVTAAGTAYEKVKQGNPVRFDEIPDYRNENGAGFAFLCDESGNPAALAAIDNENGLFLMKRVFCNQS
ncbi:MAG: tRNA pseudouridine(55) synthase TruB [Firmicutes bacterium]|nr:tRNA pseudouridine(55) synthase TruB [Bacillota bacterium]